MKRKSSKILSSLIVKFTDVQAENFFFQVKFINCYLREITGFTKNMTLETGTSLGYTQCTALSMPISPIEAKDQI